MRYIKTNLIILLSLFLPIFAPVLLVTSSVYAQSIDSLATNAESCREQGYRWDQESLSCDNSRVISPSQKLNDCQGTNIKAGEPKNSEDHCGILDYLVIAINVLSGVAMIAIIGSIIYGGIQYSMSGSDPQKVGAAKDRIRNAFIALVLFIFGYGILNYLVPGGVL